MIQAAIDGSCDATIFDWDNYKSRYGAYDGLCDFYFEGTGLVSMPVAQPVVGVVEVFEAPPWAVAVVSRNESSPQMQMHE